MARFTKILHTAAPLTAVTGFVAFAVYQVAASTLPMLHAVHSMS